MRRTPTQMLLLDLKQGMLLGLSLAVFLKAKA